MSTLRHQRHQTLFCGTDNPKIVNQRHQRHQRHSTVSCLDAINKLPGKKEFDESVKILQESIDGKAKIGIIQKNGIIYATKTIPTPTIREQWEVLEEWELVRDLKLLGYHELYNDLENHQMIIIQDFLPCNLLQYICNQKQFNTKSTKRSPKQSKRKSVSKLKADLLYPHLAEQEAKQIAMSVLMKLKKMHRYGFIHCDVKPENIMKLSRLNKNNRDLCDWRVIDFGLRVKFNVNKGFCLNSWRGTIGWTPPELIPNNGCNNRIYPELDVWCMGLVILYMVTGENPFELTIKECKENKLYTLDAGKKYWYHNKLMHYNNNKKWNHYLVFLHKKNKISLNLLDLLLNHMLVFNAEKRSSVKTVLKHNWFKDVLKMKNSNQSKKISPKILISK